MRPGEIADLRRRCLRIPNAKQIGLFGAQQSEAEGFALVSPEGAPTQSAQPGQGTQETIPGVSRKVSAQALETMRARELAGRARRRGRKRNPERYLAAKLSPAKRARLKQLHDAYFDTFEEIESLPGAQLATRTGSYVVPEGYALMFSAGGVDHLFFQDEAPETTWTFVTVGRSRDQVEHLADYLVVLERVDALSKRYTRRHNAAGKGRASR